MPPQDLDILETFLKRIPAVPTQSKMGKGRFENKNWWIKFSIDVKHPLAWNTVQELGCVLNYLSVTERLPTVFMPVSPAPYLNGGPDDFLSWVIESRDPEFSPALCAQWLENRLPKPVEDESQWPGDEE